MEREVNLYRVPRTGVVFRVKPVSVFLLDAIQRRILRPEVPKQEITRGDGKKIMEENPSHPAYIAAMEEYGRASAEAVEDALIALGSEVASVPEGLEGPEGTQWAEELAFLQMPPPDDRRHRYLHWVKYWAIRDATSLVEFTKAVRDASLTSEEAVSEAADSFRSGA